VAGTLDPASVQGLHDHAGRPIKEVLAENGVDLAAAPRAARMRAGLVAYVELHIEQGPVLESEGLPAAAVTGTAGVERFRLRFAGRPSHAGTTPMDMRRDALLAAASTALAVEGIARRHGGVGTTGTLMLEPGVITAVAGAAELGVDLRHAEREPLAVMAAETRDAAAFAAAERRCALAEEPVWSIEPIAFDGRLVEAARAATGTDRAIASGALHDAAEMARHMPAGMVFASSTGGLSHTKEEATPEADLERAIDAYGAVALRAIAGELL
jgi:N-carbamoyl-L-amino-acid hydrolase